VFRKKGTLPAGLTEEEEEVFACVDGENDVSTIIDLCGQDNFEVSKTLLSLLERGFIETGEIVPIVPQAPAIAVAAKPSLSIAGYLPYLAVSVAFCLTVAGVFIQKSGDFKNFSASKKIDALRMKIETFQLEHAAYPSSLQQVAAQKDPWGRPFIYQNTADSFFLASAGADGVEGTQDDIY
jgi:hypothetical protein